MDTNTTCRRRYRTAAACGPALSLASLKSRTARSAPSEYFGKLNGRQVALYLFKQGGAVLEGAADLGCPNRLCVHTAAALAAGPASELGARAKPHAVRGALGDGDGEVRAEGVAHDEWWQLPSAATVWALVRVAHRVARARASFGGKCAAATHGTDSRVRAPARCFRLLHTDCRAAGVLPSGGRSRERRRRCPRTRLRGIGGRGRRGRAGRAALAADEEVILREPALENVASWLEQRRVRRAEVSWLAPVLE